MHAARTTLPILIEDVSNTNLLCHLAQCRFDDNQVYANSKVSVTLCHLRHSFYTKHIQ